jgi:murein L,D-transpeptidase YafK
MKYFAISVLLLLSLAAMKPLDFFSQQMKFPRVRESYKSHGKQVNDLLAASGLDSKNLEIYLRAFKKERKLELWGRNKGTGAFSLIKAYDFCETSGRLGPKRRSGDRQIPEGFYTIDFFNPQSNFYLSYRVSYPNESDKVLSDKLNPGDNIFIHGHCITIGCIPIGDELMKELYLITIMAKSSGQDIPVHMFPCKMDEAGYAALRSEFANEPTLLEFWSWLKPGYDAFESTKTVPNVTVDPTTGKYNVQ